MTNFIPVCEPFLNGNELKYISEAVSTGWISSSGKFVKEFEEKFADYCGVKYATGVCNGTAALHLALSALDIGKNDEVIIPDFTMVASAAAVCYTGAKPVFIDVDSMTWNINVQKVEEKITPKTKAIMAVHVFGNPCNMNGINNIADKYGLKVIEDAAEAHGAEYLGLKTGALSDIAAFSFFANKNLTCGEGGMVLTNSKTLYDRCRYLKNLCFPLDEKRIFEHNDLGFNYRISNLHSAIGLAQVEKADEYITMRINNAHLYRKYLADVSGIQFQRNEEHSLNVHWMNAILIDPDEFSVSRDTLIKRLRKKSIDSRLLFTGMHKQKSLQKFGCDCSGDFGVCENLTANGLYLPSAGSLKGEQIKYICDCIKGAR